MAVILIWSVRVLNGFWRRMATVEKNGYRGPFTVTAFGKLADVPIDMLRGVFSSGIDLILVPFGTSDIIEIIDITESNPPPVNFMVISDPKACPDLTLFLKSMSYNPLQPFPYHLSMETLLEEDACGVPAETTDSVSWECLVCCAPDPPGRSFDTFEAHLSSEEHHEEVLLMQTRGPTVQPVLDLHLSRLVEAPLLTQCGDNMVDWEAPLLTQCGDNMVPNVFWDINSCPVPPDCDASMVGPCIKRFLKKEGCSGPLHHCHWRSNRLSSWHTL
ncbi:hypothetical protein CARUB_v10011406mg [Capsella rubella]|uniref:NYN domain-containing protein n=1 Tax=Capsella rubella TaxID=81985 RepID=R0IH12_9BRAS|nr:uncharacterized protein LOC17899354 [Capsella rubella]XP_023646044.1 uncharacterized protein LOC17899354 [Capsella rubella]EOA36108.1 hypothetical protein CARUB_v10011406mg [Capsella rubella]